MKIRKMLSLILILILTLSSFSTTLVFAEDEFGQTADGWKYEKSGDGYAWIINYVGNEEKVTIPQVVDGRKVVVVEIVNTNLKEIIVPDNAEFHWFTFNDCTGLEKVYVGTGIEYLYESAFAGCTSLKTVELPNTLKRIEAGAFRGCISLENIKIPDAVTRIDMGVFANTGLKNITFPENTKTFGSDVFSNCKNLENVSFLSETMHYLTDPEYGELIKNTLPDSFYNGCTKLKHLILPKSVTSICSFAFHNTGLESIDVSDSVTSIGQYAFARCNSLRSVKLSKNLKSIGYCAFLDDGLLEDLELPESLIAINGCAFMNCTSLKRVKLPETVTTIDYRAFENTGLETISLPNNTTRFGTGVFQGCKELKSVQINSNYIQYIYNYMGPICKGYTLANNLFKNCTSLTSVTIPEAVKSIGEGAFQNSGLTSITIPKNVKTIYKDAFKGCENLTSVKFAGAVNNIGRSAFSKCVNLKTVNFTKGYLKKVYDYAFYKCEKLDKITISNTKNVPSIHKSAFNKAKSGIKFYVKNNTVAKKLKAKLQKTNIKKAKIYRSAPILLYKNVG